MPERLSLGMVVPAAREVLVEAWSSDGSEYARAVVDFEVFGMEGRIASALSARSFGGEPVLGLRFTPGGTWRPSPAS